MILCREQHLPHHTWSFDPLLYKNHYFRAVFKGHRPSTLRGVPTPTPNTCSNRKINTNQCLKLSSEFSRTIFHSTSAHKRKDNCFIWLCWATFLPLERSQHETSESVREAVLKKPQHHICPTTGQMWWFYQKPCYSFFSSYTHTVPKRASVLPFSSLGSQQLTKLKPLGSRVWPISISMNIHDLFSVCVCVSQ